MIVCGLETSLRTSMSEQVWMLHSCILTQRENSRRNKIGRMVVRDILFHTSAAAISRRNTYAFSGGRDLFHLVEQKIFHLPREEPLGRQITSPRNKVLVLKPERRMSTQLTMTRVHGTIKEKSIGEDTTKIVFGPWKDSLDHEKSLRQETMKRVSGKMPRKKSADHMK